MTTEGEKKIKRAVIHRQVYRNGPFGGTRNTTICGRQNNGGEDTNVTIVESEVTCKFCLRIGRCTVKTQTAEELAEELERYCQSLDDIGCDCVKCRSAKAVRALAKACRKWEYHAAHPVGGIREKEVAEAMAVVDTIGLLKGPPHAQ